MRLYLFVYGRNEATGAPAPGYLIQTDDGSNVLIDTGFSRETIGAYKQPGYSGMRVDEDDYVTARLASLGLRPADIRYLVCTHLDPDHAGGHDEFPESELVIQRSHYEAARAEVHPRFGLTRAHWDDPRLRYRLVDGDTELLPGVELIEAGGHVPGLQAVLVRLPQTGPVLLAIDAMPRDIAGFTPETRPIGPFDMDEAGTRASTRKLLDLAAREGVTLTIYGHDPDQWKTLRVAPEFYE
jgi:N-acyl homoserine lactone hydrolase